MSNIRDSRNARNLNRAFRKLAKIGKHPSFAAVLNQLRGLLGRDKTGSVIEPAKFVNGESFPLTDFNKNLEDIKHELDLLFDEATYRSSRVLESNIILEEQVAELKRQILKIREANERELLIASSNFLDALVIRFADREYVSDDTTANVDTTAGIVTLPQRAGARRVVPSKPPTSPLELETQDDDAQVLPGSSFKSLFSDVLVGWQVRTTGNYLRVRTNLRETLTGSRIRIEAPDEGMLVELRLSPDGQNFIRPADAKRIRGGGVEFFFEERDFQYVELMLTSTQPPATDGTVFTLDKLVFYNEGYQTDASLVTEDIVRDDGGDIKLARIEVEHELAPNTWVDVEVTDAVGNYRRVENQIVNFTASNRESVVYRANTTDVLLQSYSSVIGPRGFTAGGSPVEGLGINDVWGVDDTTFFGLKSIPSNIDSRGLRLFRSNNWGVDKRDRVDTVATVNSMLLDPGEKRNLYVAVVDESLQNGNSTSTTIDTSRQIMTGQNVVLTGTDDAQIIRVTGTLDFSSMTYPGSPGDRPEFQAEVVIEGTDDRIIRLQDDPAASDPVPAFIEDYDVVLIEDVGEVRIVGVDAQGRTLLDPTTEIDAGVHNCKLQTRDLTNQVTNIAGNTITFGVNLREYEKVLVTYLSPIDGVTEQVVGPSVKVFSTRDGTEGVPGRDFRIRDGQIELLNTNGLPTTSGATPEVPVRIEFEYVRNTTSEVSYYTYARVPDGPNKIVKIGTPISLDHTERVVWTDPAGRAVDMTGLTTMVLAPGLHRFSVVGNRAIDDGGKIDTTTALYKLISLSAEDGGYIFDFNSGYITDMTGFPEPLTPATRFYLERAARKDNHENFAWEDSLILTNFNMADPDDAVTIEPGNDTVVDRADYRLSYRYYESNGLDRFKIRVNLHREPGDITSRTPTIHGIKVLFTE